MPIRWITHAIFAGTQLIEDNCEMQKEPCIHGEKLEVYERTGVPEKYLKYYMKRQSGGLRKWRKSHRKSRNGD